MAINKVVYDGDTLIDLTGDTAVASDVASGKTFHLADGTIATGTASGGGGNDFIITFSQDQNDMWVPDKTFAEIAAAYTAGKNIGANAVSNGDDILASVNDYDSEDELFYYSIFDSDTGELIWYWMDASQVDVDWTCYLYDTSIANAEPADVENGKVFYNADGYQTGTGGIRFDTKTVSLGASYPTSLSFTDMRGEPKAFVLRLNASISSSGSTTYYYIVDIAAFGSTTHGHCFRIGSTRQVVNVTSGYSWSYSGTTLTITSSASSRSSSPGVFTAAGYELMYIY